MKDWHDSLHVAPEARFSGMAENYDWCRPLYPRSLLDWILVTAGITAPAKIVDVGCGTGIATRQFVERGFDVIGIEPNKDMLNYARKLGGAAYEGGTATATGLPDASIDMAVIAQAFHWFDVPAAMRELARILRPHGGCAAFWNKRVSTPLLTEYDEILHRYREHKENIPGPDETIAAIKGFAGIASVHDAKFPNSQELDRDRFFGRAYSASYVVHDIKRRKEFDEALGELFARRQVGGFVTFTYDTLVLFWRFADTA